jgi:hypothetical protein
MAGLSEKYSENKRRRGRPRVFSEEVENLFTRLGIGGECLTRRGKLNWWHAQMAVSALKDAPGLDWLFNWDQMLAGTGKVRWSILSELGRIQNGDDMRALAAQVCEEKPKTVLAVSMIREFRTGTVVPASADGLKAALHRTLDAYQVIHPEISYRLMCDVLKGLWEEMKLGAARAHGPAFVPYASGAKMPKAAKRKG